MKELRDRLASCEARDRELREERATLKKAFETARLAAQEHESDATMGAAVAAKESLQRVEHQLEQLHDEHVGLLRRLGDAEAGRAGWSLPGVNGWHEAARKLDLARGQLRVDVPAAALFNAPALPPSSSSYSVLAPASTGGTAPPASPRHLFPVLPAAPIGARAADLSATDFTIVWNPAELQLSGVERAPDATTQKAKLSPTVSLANPVARQFAAVLDSVPSKLFDSQDALRALLAGELARQLDEVFDAHVVGKIEAASPLTGSTGSDLVAQIRNAIADARDVGTEPRYLAVTPSDAAGLDLAVDGEGHYVFSVQSAGAGSPIWSVFVREVPSISNPTLIDPARLGLVYAGQGSILVDPYGQMGTNQVRVRVEAEAVFHVRDPYGAYAISAS